MHIYIKKKIAKVGNWTVSITVGPGFESLSKGLRWSGVPKVHTMGFVVMGEPISISL